MKGPPEKCVCDPRFFRACPGHGDEGFKPFQTRSKPVGKRDAERVERWVRRLRPAASDKEVQALVTGRRWAICGWHFDAGRIKAGEETTRTKATMLPGSPLRHEPPDEEAEAGLSKAELTAKIAAEKEMAAAITRPAFHAPRPQCDAVKETSSTNAAGVEPAPLENKSALPYTAGQRAQHGLIGMPAAQAPPTVAFPSPVRPWATRVPAPSVPPAMYPTFYTLGLRYGNAPGAPPPSTYVAAPQPHFAATAASPPFPPPVATPPPPPQGYCNLNAAAAGGSFSTMAQMMAPYSTTCAPGMAQPHVGLATPPQMLSALPQMHGAQPQMRSAPPHVGVAPSYVGAASPQMGPPPPVARLAAGCGLMSHGLSTAGPSPGCAGGPPHDSPVAISRSGSCCGLTMFSPAPHSLYGMPYLHQNRGVYYRPPPH